MKKLMAVAAAAAMFGAMAEEAFTFVNAENGYSYILVNQNLDSFKFDISKYGEEGARDNPGNRWGEGHFKYYTYKGDVVAKTVKETSTIGSGRHQHTVTTTSTVPADSATGEAIETTPIEKGVKSIDLGAVSAGTKIGFFFDDRNEAEWAYSFADSGKYQNGGRDYLTYTASDNEILVSFASEDGGRNNSNYDDWMAISISASTGGGATTNGAPLPGALAAIAVGMVGAGLLKKKK